MDNNYNNFRAIEPLMSNRWILETYPLKINPYLFNYLKLYNESNVVILETKFMETIEDVFNPMDLLEITDITLKYLSPIGEVINGLKMIVSGINFEKECLYSSDELMTTKLRFVIETMEIIYNK